MPDEAGGRGVIGGVPLPSDFVLFVSAGLFATTGLAASTPVDSSEPSILLFETFMNVGLALLVLSGTLYLRRSELPRSTWWNVVVGYLGGIAFIGVLLVWANLPDIGAGGSIFELRDDFVFYGNLGGLFGFVTGVTRARSEYNRQLRRDLEVSNELLESSQEALWMFTADRSEVLYLNAAYEEIFGQPRDALVDDPTAFLEAVHPDDREFVRDQLERLSDGEAVEYEIRVNRTADFARTVWVKGQPISLDGEQFAISGFARDITDRKERQRRYEAIFNQTYQFTGLMEPDGTLVEANDTALAFGGVDREDVIGEKIWDAYWFRVSEETRRQVRDGVERAAAGSFVHHELDVQGETETAVIDFSIRPIRNDDGDVTLLIPEGRNITELKRHERRVTSLHETTRRLFQAETRTQAAQIATSAANDVLGLPINAMWFYDPDEDALVPAAWSAAAEEPFDEIPTFQRGEGLAWKVFESGEASLFDDVRGEDERLNPETNIRSEMILPLDDAGVFIAGSMTDAEFDDRQLSLAKLLATNVTSALDRIESQRELEARQRDLERQIERLDEFAGIVSHDLRNPLSVAKGNLELLRQDEGLEGHDDLERVSRALERMTGLIDDLLTLARAGEGVDELERVPLDRVVHGSWSIVDTDGTELRTEIDGTVRADESRLAQLLENLFRNAVEHGSTSPRSETHEDAVEHGSTSEQSKSDDGGEHAGTDAVVTVGELPDGFFVADDGPGFDDADPDRIFETGYSTNEEGTGFGLSIVAEIADAHGWGVDVTESQSGGVRFEFTGVETSS